MPTQAIKKVLVVGGGGLPGFAWTLAALGELRRRGFHLEEADRVIGTSAGGIAAALLLSGINMEEALASASSQLSIPAKWIPWLTIYSTLGNQLLPGNPAFLSQIYRPSRNRGLEGWEGTLKGLTRGIMWPANLELIATDPTRAKHRILMARDGVPLHTALAASSTVPGIFRPTDIEGHPYIDGGFRSVTNADLVSTCDRVVAVSPRNHALFPSRRAENQLRNSGADFALLRPALATALAMGAHPLRAGHADLLMRDGVRVARRRVEKCREIWLVNSH